jgi:hypothetical protein
LSQERQLPQRKHNECKKETLYTGKLRQIISRDEHGINNKTYKKEFAGKTKKQSRRDTYTMHHAQ